MDYSRHSPPRFEPVHWRKSSKQMSRRASSHSIYSQDGDKPSGSRSLSSLVRRDSLELQRPARPHRPQRDTVDLTAFQEGENVAVGSTKLSPAMQQLGEALGPLEDPTPSSAATPTDTYPKSPSPPRRKPVPALDDLGDGLMPPSEERQNSFASEATMSSLQGRKAQRRDDLRRLASILGQDIFKGVDVEAIVNMERKTPKRIGTSTPALPRSSMVLVTAPMISAPLITPPRAMEAGSSKAGAGPSSMTKSKSLRTAPSVYSSSSQGPRKLQRTRSQASRAGAPAQLARRPSTGKRLLNWLGSGVTDPGRHSTTPPVPKVPQARRAQTSESDESLSYLLKADPPLDPQLATGGALPGTASTADVRISPTCSIFGRALGLMPEDAFCVAMVGGERHRLPIVVFAAVEQLFKRGLNTSGLFRLPGDQANIDALAHAFDSAPLFGDHETLEDESIHDVAGLFKRYLRELPAPVLDERLTRLFSNACIESDAPLGLRVIAARNIIRLLPKPQLSLFVYLLAFLAQVPLNRGCHLDHKALGLVLGPAMLAARSDSIVGLGAPSARAAAGLAALDTEGAKAIREAQVNLTWLIENWAVIGADFITPNSAHATDLSDNSPLAQLGTHGLGVSIQEATPHLSHEGVLSEPTSPHDPPNNPPGPNARRLRQPTEETETSASVRSRSPAPSFGSRSIRSSGTGSSVQKDFGARNLERSSSATFGEGKRGADGVQTAAQTRKIVALEAELAEVRRISASQEELLRGGTLLDRETAKLVETQTHLEAARQEGRRLRELLERERWQRSHRIEELEQALELSKQENRDVTAKLASVRSLLGFT